jgi:PIN domain nuclease of toxin-antitoxin system
VSAAYLLDTQAFLLWRIDSPALGAQAVRALEDAGAEHYLSLASIWEISIKRSIGKLELDVSTQELVESAVAAGVRLLGVRPEHCYRLEGMPWHHRDPFDRLLVAQALVDGLEVVAQDAAFRSYGVRVVW